MLYKKKMLFRSGVFLLTTAAANFAFSQQLPKAIKMEPAVYPLEAKSIGATGKVAIKFEIDESGRVESASVAKSSGSDVLDSAAIDAVMNYRFEKPNYSKNASRPTYTKVIDFNEASSKQEERQDDVAQVKYDIPPKILETVPTVYPIEARRYRLEGVVSLALYLGTDGRLENAKVVKSSGYNMLDEAALETVKNYKFSPASVKGKNVASIKDLRISFKLTPSDEELANDKLANELNLCGDRISDTALRGKVSELVRYLKVPEKVSKISEALEAAISQELSPHLQPSKNDELSAEQKHLMSVKKQIVSKIRYEYSWDKIEPVYIKAYCDTFTNQEIDDMLTFFKSPVGQSMLIKGTYLEAKMASEFSSIFSSQIKSIYDTLQSAVSGYEQEGIKN